MNVEKRKMIEDLYRTWKKKGILKRRGAKLRNAWKRNHGKIKRIRSKNLTQRKENDKKKRINMVQTKRLKQCRTDKKQEISSLFVRATNQASLKNAQISRNLANQLKAYSRS